MATGIEIWVESESEEDETSGVGTDLENLCLTASTSLCGVVNSELAMSELLFKWVWKDVEWIEDHLEIMSSLSELKAFTADVEELKQREDSWL